MSRSGYDDDCGGWQLNCWRGAVSSAIRGRRGQEFLRELADALDAMPEKVLIRDELESDGQYCALGVIGHARGMDLSTIDPMDRLGIALSFEISEALAAEIEFENDDGAFYRETPQARWERMRRWVASKITSAK
jgi:hypothetical protein